MDGEQNNHRSRSSSLFSGGDVLCCDSTSTGGFIHGSNRFWALQNMAVAAKVWEQAKSMGVTGSLRDDVYVNRISEAEQRYNEACLRRKAKSVLK